MATVTWTDRLDLGALRALLSAPQGGLARDMFRRGLKVETQAKRNLAGVGGPRRIDTGRLRASIHTTMVMRNGLPAALVGTNVKYAIYVHEGTGLFGPRHMMIRPKRAKLLRFRPKGSRRYIYVRQVRGMQRNRFLLNALPAARL